jgi:hypothetical protein
LPLIDEIVEPLVRLFGGTEAGELPHRPRPTAVHRRVRAAGVRLLAGKAEILLVVEVRDVLGRVQPIDLVVRDGREPVVPLAVLQILRERLLLPLLPALADLFELVLVEHGLR